MSARPARRAVPIWLRIALGAALVVSASTFVGGGGLQYLGDAPEACAGCHIMQEPYRAWQAGSHHAVAVCNDCHTPSSPAAKYLTKARSGWNHALAYTTGRYPAEIRATPASLAIIETNCRGCHGFLADSPAVTAVPHAERGSCPQCHAGVAHGAAAALSSGRGTGRAR